MSSFEIDLMTLEKLHPHPLDKTVFFVEISEKYGNHKYVCVATDVPYSLSVTGLIDLVSSSHFDADANAERLSKNPTIDYNAGIRGCGAASGRVWYLPMTAQAIKDRWQRANELGTLLHYAIEVELNRRAMAVLLRPKPMAIPDEENMKPFALWEEWWGHATAGTGMWTGRGKLEAYRCEFTVVDPENDTAGRLDFLALNIITGKYVLIDWKRCLTKDEKPGFSYAYRGKKLLPPLDDMEDCKLSHWRIQANVYRAILEKYYNLPIEAMMMVVLHPDNDTALVFEHPIDTRAETLLQESKTLLKKRKEKEAARVAEETRTKKEAEERAAKDTFTNALKRARAVFSADDSSDDEDVYYPEKDIAVPQPAP